MTKERDLGLLEVVNCGKLTRKYIADKGLLNRVCYADSSQVFQVLERETPLQREIYVTFTSGNLCLDFRQKGGVKRALPVSLVFSNAFSST